MHITWPPLLPRALCTAPPSGSYLRARGCSTAPHPGRPPILQSPGGLVTLLSRDGAKIDPGVGLERWDELKQSEDGDGEGARVTLVEVPSRSLFSSHPHPPTPGIGEWDRTAAARAGVPGPWSQPRLGKGRQEPARGVPSRCLTRSVGWRRPRRASGESSPLGGSEGLWLPGGEPGGPRHGLERRLRTAIRVPRSPGPLACLPPSSTHPVWDSGKETFSGFLTPLPP